MRNSVIIMTFLFSCFVFAVEEKSSDGQILVSIPNSDETREFFISWEILSHFKAFNHEKPIKINLQSLEEISAFEKIIRFMKENNGISADFLTPDDLTDLIFLIFSYDIAHLGIAIAEFIESEVYRKINTCETVTVLFDDLSGRQFKNFFDKIKGIHGHNDWLSRINNAFSEYVHYVKILDDARLKGLPIAIDANRCAQISAIQIHCQDMQDLEAQNRKKALAQQKFEENVQRISNEIITKVLHGMRKQPGCYNTEVPEAIKKRNFLVKRKYLKAVIATLQEQLVAFNVYSNIDDWCLESDLDSKEKWPDTCGGLVAQSVATIFCLFQFPTQCLTINYCCFCCTSSCHSYCHDDCVGPLKGQGTCSTRVGGAFRHCIYKGATCNQRWIIIEPKSDPFGIPPVIHLDMNRAGFASCHA